MKFSYVAEQIQSLISAVKFIVGIPIRKTAKNLVVAHSSQSCPA